MSRIRKLSLSTLRNYRRTWRAALLLLALIAIFGPWTYERVYMPAAVRCPPSNAHIEGDLYCGIPLSILWELLGLLRWDATADLVAGRIDLAQWAPQFLYKIISLLLVLPLLITAGLVTSKLPFRWGAGNAAAWILAAVAAGAYLERGYYRPYAAPWGNLLFLAVALAVLILELLLLARSPSPTPTTPPSPRPS